MRLSTWIKALAVLWLVAEGLAFVLVVRLIGLPEALLIGVLTSLFGWTLLKRAGMSAMIKLRAAVGERRIVEVGQGRFLDETLASVGALALLAPGFVSDLIGLALAVPLVRERLVTRFAKKKTGDRWVPEGPRTSAGPTNIDLAPGEWRRSEPSASPATDA